MQSRGCTPAKIRGLRGIFMNVKDIVVMRNSILLHFRRTCFSSGSDISTMILIKKREKLIACFFISFINMLLRLPSRQQREAVKRTRREAILAYNMMP